MYAPTYDAEDEVKNSYYNALQAQINKTPQHDVLIIDDQNAKVRNDNRLSTANMKEPWEDKVLVQ